MSTTFEFTLSSEDTERLFALKEEWGEKNLSGNEFAEELLHKCLRKLYPEEVRYNEYGERIMRKVKEQNEKLSGQTRPTIRFRL